MKNQLFTKKGGVLLVVFITLISGGIYLYQNQNNSEDIKGNKEFSQKASEPKNQESETITEENSISTVVTDKFNQSDILQEKITSRHEVTSEPKEYRVVAEEILYPEEYDFGDEISSITAAVGTPIKFNALQITKANINDTIELEFDGKRFNAEIFKKDESYHKATETDEGTEQTTIWFDSYIDPLVKKIWKNQIEGSISYDLNGVVDGEIRIQDKGGDYAIYINKNVAYYVLEDEWRKEFYRQGNTID